jgi:hypothetical protein
MTDYAGYIGTPWEAGAQGPQAYDCMSFFRLIQARHFGIQVPAIIAPDYEDHTVLVELFGNHAERSRWQRVDRPRHGDAVIIHKPMHIGTWLEIDGGGVLHCVRGAGVVFTSDSSWRMSGFGRREYYTFQGIK